MPLTAAKTKTAFENTKQDVKTKGNPTVVTVMLTFDGVEYKPIDLYEALDAKFGTVSSDADTIARHAYRLRIKP